MCRPVGPGKRSRSSSSPSFLQVALTFLGFKSFTEGVIRVANFFIVFHIYLDIRCHAFPFLPVNAIANTAAHFRSHWI